MKLTSINATIMGEPVPQGSMVAIPVKGKKFSSVVSSNRKALEPWRRRVGYQLSAEFCKLMAANGWHPTADEPTPEPYKKCVSVTVVFALERPKDHHVCNDRDRELKTRAPKRCAKLVDVDKLQRAIGDAITGVVIYDDRLIDRWAAKKRWTEPGELPHAEILITFED